MSKCFIRHLLEVVMCLGAVLFLVPYLKGEMHRAIPLVVVGFVLTLGCGLLRCAFLDGECSERTEFTTHS